LSFISEQPLHPGVLSTCLRTLRILSRDRQALTPLVTDRALLTLASHGGIASGTALPHEREEEEEEEEEAGPQEAQDNRVTGEDGDRDGGGDHDDHSDHAGHQTPAVASGIVGGDEEPDAEESSGGGRARSGTGAVTITVVMVAEEELGKPAPRELPSVRCPTSRPRRRPELRAAPGVGVGGILLARGKKDAREDRSEGGEGQEEEGEVCRKEAMKTLCNVIYNSQTAQDRASALR